VKKSPSFIHNNKQENNNDAHYTLIPTRVIGPVKLQSNHGLEFVKIPMATYEKPLWPSTQRGARVTLETDGIFSLVSRDHMARSVLLQTHTLSHTQKVLNHLRQVPRVTWQQIIESTSRFAKFHDIHLESAGRLVYVRFSITTGDAAGHNMVTKACDELAQWICAQFETTYVSVSANYCSDKKATAINGILGRGKSVSSEILISRKTCETILKTTPEKLIDLNFKKNWMGTMLAGGIRSANAHFANTLLATYLATGQDAANVVEGSQGNVVMHMEGKNDLYMGINLPNLIVGTVGVGKHCPRIQHYFNLMLCHQHQEQPGDQAHQLAKCISAAVLCSELSLLAALTNVGELVDTHMRIERINNE
jgi:hydroxymethylglutaryl-CoA reductase (NADPH)